VGVWAVGVGLVCVGWFGVVEGVVTQGNALVLGHQVLSLHEKRLVLLGLSRLGGRGVGDSLDVVVEVGDLVGFGVGNAHRSARLAVDGLYGRGVVVGVGGGLRALPWLESVEYVRASFGVVDSSRVLLVFNGGLREFVLGLSGRFSSVPLRLLLGLGSFLSVRLFEVLWCLSFGGRLRSVSVGVDDLRFSLGLVEVNLAGGLGGGVKYGSWREFFRLLVRLVGSFAAVGCEVGVSVGRKVGGVGVVEVRFDLVRFGRSVGVGGDVEGRLARLGVGVSLGGLLERGFSLSGIEVALGVVERRVAGGGVLNAGGYFMGVLRSGVGGSVGVVEVGGLVGDSVGVVEVGGGDGVVVGGVDWWGVARDRGLSLEDVRGLVRSFVVESGNRVLLGVLERSGWSGRAFDALAVECLEREFGG
jgi:hypothetical protein